MRHVLYGFFTGLALQAMVALTVMATAAHGAEGWGGVGAEDTLIQVQNGSRCATHDEVAALLSNKYGEYPVSAGVTRAGSIVEVFATSSGNTWSIVVTSLNGQSCLVAVGENWIGKNAMPPASFKPAGHDI